jgi:hypothetical protein
MEEAIINVRRLLMSNAEYNRTSGVKSQLALIQSGHSMKKPMSAQIPLAFENG